MNKETQELIKQFKKIVAKRWIPSVNKGLGSVGLTFEKELNKNPDSLFFPDYYGVEIKCTTRFSKFPISLFSIAFDGPTFPEINRILEKYGYFDPVYKNKKILFSKLSCTEKHYVNNRYKFQLEIDDDEEKLYLSVYDLFDCLLERKSFVYLESIFNHLTLKLNNLAIVYASKKVIHDKEHFRYYKICLYKLRGYDTFLNLLKNGKIEVYLEGRIARSGKDIGKYKNKNLIFKIKKELIQELFTEFYIKNYDEINSITDFSIMPEFDFDAIKIL